FVLDTVLNKGLIDGWNWVSDKILGGKFKVGHIPIPKFASGGIMPGYTPGKDVGLAALSGGEAVMRPEWTRAVGEKRVEQWNVAARTRGSSGVAKLMGIPGYAEGGIFDRVKAAGASAVGMVNTAITGVTQFIKDPGAYI